MDARLRAAITSEIGESDRKVDNRFEARRRARDAAEAAAAVLRAEGYYAAVVEPDVGEGGRPSSGWGRLLRPTTARPPRRRCGSRREVPDAPPMSWAPKVVSSRS
jgi:hypothetical protein